MNDTPPNRPAYLQAHLEQSEGDDFHQIIEKMNTAALNADIGGGETARLYTNFSEARLPPIRHEAKTHGSLRYDLLAATAASFSDRLELLAVTLYSSAKNPKTDIKEKLRKQLKGLQVAAELWLSRVNPEDIYRKDPSYIRSPDLMPNLLRAVEAAMCQSLVDQGIKPETATPSLP